MNRSTTLAFALASLVYCQVASADTPTGETAVITDGTKTPAFNMNVEVNPFFLLFGGIQGALSFRVDKTKAVGPTLSTYGILGTRTTSLGAQGQYSLQDKDVMDDGLILNGSLEFLTYSIEVFGENYRHNALLATTSVNWQWVYANGFNIRVGGGLAAQAGFGDDIDYSSVSGQSLLSVGDNFAMHAFVDAKLAWAF